MHDLTPSRSGTLSDQATRARIAAEATTPEGHGGLRWPSGRDGSAGGGPTEPAAPAAKSVAHSRLILLENEFPRDAKGLALEKPLHSWRKVKSSHFINNRLK